MIVDQFIDRSFAREKSFFGNGCVAHVSMAHPVCPRLGDAAEAAARGLGLPVTRGGTYLVMEGPQFSTRAESELYRAWGCSVIGMTNMPEAKLAREAELCYATVAMVTDYDCWHEDHGAVTVDQVIRVLLENADKARALVRAVLPELGKLRGPCPAGCDRALDHALITAPDARDPALVAKLDARCGTGARSRRERRVRFQERDSSFLRELERLWIERSAIVAAEAMACAGVGVDLDAELRRLDRAHWSMGMCPSSSPKWSCTGQCGVSPRDS